MIPYRFLWNFIRKERMLFDIGYMFVERKKIEERSFFTFFHADFLNGKIS